MIKKFARRLPALAILFLGFAGMALASPQTVINPETDLVYLGAFRVPNDTSGNTIWTYGGGGLCFNPEGDAENADGFPGSLFGIGRAKEGKLSEYVIPVPVVSRKLTDLPIARVIQTFQDVTAGLIPGINPDGGYKMGDIQLIKQRGMMTEDKLFWALYEYYMPETDLLTFGWSRITLDNPMSEGLARVGNDTSSATSRYLFEIPEEWANRYTGGRRIAAGRFRGQSGGSLGPTLFAIDPTQSASLQNGTLFNATTLLRYAEDHPIKDFSRGGEEWSDGAWLTINGRQAVMIAGGKGVRTEDNGLLYYGPPETDGCGSKGYHAEPYYAAILFYDPDDLAAVVQGVKDSYEVMPYACFNVEQYMFTGFTCRRKQLGGVGYDRANQLLYIEELEVGNGISVYDKSPVVHVWRLIDPENSRPLDATPPSVPANTTTSDSTVGKKVTWNPSYDQSGTIYYIVYRNDLPIAMTMGTEFTDANSSLLAGVTLSYKIEARDALNNSSFSVKPVPIPVLKSITIR